jgi:hypothetical protein
LRVYGIHTGELRNALKFLGSVIASSYASRY